MRFQQLLQELVLFAQARDCGLEQLDFSLKRIQPSLHLVPVAAWLERPGRALMLHSPGQCSRDGRVHDDGDDGDALYG